MQKKVIQEAVANITSTSAALRAYCNEPRNYNTEGGRLLDRVVWELSLQLRDLQEIQNAYGM